MKPFSIFLTALTFALIDIAAAQDFWQRAGLDSLIVCDLQVAADGHIFAGTNRGVYQSLDKGEHWTCLGLSDANGAVRTLVVNSLDYIIAGVGWDGVYRSTDKGATWKKVFSGVNPSDIVANSSEQIFLGFSDGTYAGGGVFRSTDKGQTWDSLWDRHRVSGLCVHQSGHIFALCWYSGTAVFRSTDNGTTWTMVQVVIPGFYTEPQWMAVSPNGDIYCSGALRSIDSGATWTRLNLECFTGAIAFNSNGHIFIASDLSRGVLRSIDGGYSWDSLNIGLQNQGVLSLAVDPDENIFAGTESGVFRSMQATTSFEESSPESPTAFKLEHNYPNPFNPATRIKYTIGVASGRGQVASVRLSVYDVLGREVVMLVNEKKAPGNYEVTFDGTHLSSGTYFYRLTAGDCVATKKLLLLK